MINNNKPAPSPKIKASLVALIEAPVEKTTSTPISYSQS